MTLPAIRTMTIDAHDESIPVIRLRFVTKLDGVSLLLTRDVGEYLGINADEDDDCLDVLTDFGIPFTTANVKYRGQIIGPVGLISECDHKRLVAEVSKLRQDN